MCFLHCLQSHLTTTSLWSTTLRAERGLSVTETVVGSSRAVLWLCRLQDQLVEVTEQAAASIDCEELPVRVSESARELPSEGNASSSHGPSHTDVEPLLAGEVLLVDGGPLHGSRASSPRQTPEAIGGQDAVSPQRYSRVLASHEMNEAEVGQGHAQHTGVPTVRQPSSDSLPVVSFQAGKNVDTVSEDSSEAATPPTRAMRGLSMRFLGKVYTQTMLIRFVWASTL